MKKLVCLMVGLVILAGVASAGTVTASVTVTNGQAITYTPAVNISGVLDKLEVVQTSGCTATVTVATFSGTTAIESFASLTALVGNKVVRPRVLPTDNTGTSLAAAFGGDAVTNVTRMITVPYSRPTIGGNVLVAVTPSGASATGTGTNTVVVTFYYDKNPLIAW